MLIEARLNCVHPLCHRWPTAKKQVRRLVRGDNLDNALRQAREELDNPYDRRCRECRRPVSLKHLTYRLINPADGSYLEE